MASGEVLAFCAICALCAGTCYELHNRAVQQHFAGCAGAPQDEWLAITIARILLYGPSILCLCSFVVEPTIWSRNMHERYPQRHE